MMRVKRTFGINLTANKRIRGKLENLGVDCSSVSPLGILSFDVYEDSRCYAPILSLMQKEGAAISPFVSEYSAEEMAGADWLMLRCIWVGPSPIPDELYYDRVYRNYCSKCASGIEQYDYFCLAKTPIWKNRYFYQPMTPFEHLFINGACASVLSDNKISGYKLLSVKAKEGVLTDIQQLVPFNTANPGLLCTENTVRSVLQCDVCGTKRYLMTGRGYSYDHRAFENEENDILLSSEYFGSEFCRKFFIVSNHFYNVVKKHELGRSLDFEPITLV